MEKIRINKFLALKGIASRREIDRLIENGEIRVNNELATSGMKVSEEDRIEISGKKIKFQESSEKKVYFLLNKPVKVLSASKDDRGRKTVIDLIKCEQRIFPIGRLDYDTEGAIILTNDGELFNKIIHPRTEVFKEYEALVRGFVDDNKIMKLQNGVELEDGITLPAKVSILSRDTLKSAVIIAIREGKNRQIRRMFDAVGNRVEKLKRTKIGDIDLKGLKAGMYRELTEKEVKYLYSLGEE